MRISDWSSDVCSSDLYREPHVPVRLLEPRLEQRPRTPEATAPYALHSVASRQRLLRRPRPRPLRGYAGASPRPFAAARLARSGRSPRFQAAPPRCTASSPNWATGWEMGRASLREGVGKYG